MIQDALQTKERIITFIRLRGPSLPVHIAKDTGLSILFASAFLSDLYSEKMISISNIKIGSSPLYFIPGQEPQLENFSRYLKSKEKEAFLILKEKKFLRDSELQPAIRVALREIKDFAIPFRKEEEIYWRFFTAPEENFAVQKIEKPAEEKIEIVEAKQQEVVVVVENKSEEVEEKKIEDIFETSAEEKKEEPIRKDKPKSSRPRRQNKNKKKDENFFNKTKEFLEKEGIEILDIKDFKNDEAILKIKRGKEEELLFVFNKKKITEKDVLKSYKRASENNMSYSVLSMSETPKKLNDLIEAIRNLSEIGKIE
jgi:hypothetical protein